MGKSKYQSYNKFRDDCQSIGGSFSEGGTKGKIGRGDDEYHGKCKIENVTQIQAQSHFNRKVTSEMGSYNVENYGLMMIGVEKKPKSMIVVGLPGLRGGSWDKSGIHLIDKEGKEDIAVVVDARPEMNYEMTNEQRKEFSPKEFGGSTSVGNVKVNVGNNTCVVKAYLSDNRDSPVFDGKDPWNRSVGSIRVDCKI